MARIAGVNIPDNKRVQISLRYIYGIGPKNAAEICEKLGIPEERRVNQLSDEEIRWKTDGTRTYQDLTLRCLATMTETDPLTAIEPDRKRIHMPDVVPLVALKKRD